MQLHVCQRWKSKWKVENVILVGSNINLTQVMCIPWLLGRFSFSALWRKVMVGAASHNDMLDIVNTWYPSLEPLSWKLVGNVIFILHIHLLLRFLFFFFLAVFTEAFSVSRYLFGYWSTWRHPRGWSCIIRYFQQVLCKVFISSFFLIVLPCH